MAVIETLKHTYKLILEVASNLFLEKGFKNVTSDNK